MSQTFPDRALSVRQPWAWAIMFGGKDIENRSAGAVKHMTHRGRFAVHASKGMTQDEYEATDWMRGLGLTPPAARDLMRGGIIGTVTLVEVVKDSASPWFFGPRGLVLKDPEPCDFIPCVGSLGFFDWRRGQGGEMCPPAKWMLPKPERVVQTALPLIQQGSLI